MKNVKNGLSSNIIQELFNKIVLSIKSQHTGKCIVETEKKNFPGFEGEGLLLVIPLVEGIVDFSCSAVIAHGDHFLELKLFATHNPEIYFLTENRPKEGHFSKLRHRQNTPSLLSFKYVLNEREYFIDSQLPGHHPHVQQLDIFVRNIQTSLLQIFRSTIPVRYHRLRALN